MKRILAGLTAIFMSGAGALWADDNVVVIELFTSQGCSSCPPADKLLGELSARADLLPLALHVDYWDYIGWKDRFARPENTARQKAYAVTAGRRMVYTPQMIIQGREDVVGTHPKDVAMLVRKHADHDSGVDISVRRNGAKVVVGVSSDKPMNGAIVQLVRYQPSEWVDIKRGENAGRKIKYHNIVRDLTVVGEWNGRTAAQFAMTIEGPLDGAVIVQAKGYGPIYGAARLK